MATQLSSRAAKATTRFARDGKSIGAGGFARHYSAPIRRPQASQRLRKLRAEVKIGYSAIKICRQPVRPS